MGESLEPDAWIVDIDEDRVIEVRLFLSPGQIIRDPALLALLDANNVPTRPLRANRSPIDPLRKIAGSDD